MKIVSVTLYEFKELSAEAQKKVLIDLADINVFFDEGKGDEELLGDANVIATIEANDYWFMEDGTVFMHGRETSAEEIDVRGLLSRAFYEGREIKRVDEHRRIVTASQHLNHGLDLQTF